MRKTFLPWIIVPAGIVLAGFFGPWWTGVIWTVIVLALFRTGIKQGILIGGISFGMVWLIVPFISLMNDDSNLIGRVSELLGGVSQVVLILVTTIVGIITGVLSGWLGSAIGQLFGRKVI